MTAQGRLFSRSGLSRSGRMAAAWSLLTASAVLLSSCQSLFSPAYQSTLRPSDNPQTVEEVQKNDPRAQMGAREHPRIVASYGGEYRDAKTERLVARIAGALTAVFGKPAAVLPHHHPQFACHQRLCAAGRLSLRNAWASGACQRRFGSGSRAFA